MKQSTYHDTGLIVSLVEQSTKCSAIMIAPSYYGYVLVMVMEALETKNESYDSVDPRQCQLLSDI